MFTKCLVVYICGLIQAPLHITLTAGDLSALVLKVSRLQEVSTTLEVHNTKKKGV